MVAIALTFIYKVRHSPEGREIIDQVVSSGAEAIGAAADRATAPPPDSVLLDDQVRLAPGQFVSWRVNLDAPRLVKLRLNVRSNQSVNYYWMEINEVEAFRESETGMAGGRFFYLQEFYGQGVRQVDDARSLGAGQWGLVIQNPGQVEATGDLHLATNEPSGTVLVIPRPPSGGPIGEGSGRYRLRITAYEVSRTKLDGSAWDMDGSAADPRFMIVGRGLGSVQRLTSVQCYTNRRVSRQETDAWEFDWNGTAPVVLLAFDDDAVGAELIGAAAVSQGRTPAQDTVVLGEADPTSNQPACGSVTLSLAWEKVR